MRTGYSGGGYSSTSASKEDWSGIDIKSVLSLGYGPINQTRLEQLVQSGEVTYEVINGVIYFRKVEKTSENSNSGVKSDGGGGGASW